MLTDVKALIRFQDQFEKFIDTIQDQQERENIVQLVYLYMIYPDNNGNSPFDLALK